MNLKELIENKKMKSKIEQAEAGQLMVLEQIVANPLISINELIKATNLTKFQINNYIYALKKKGILTLERRWKIHTN